MGRRAGGTSRRARKIGFAATIGMIGAFGSTGLISSQIPTLAAPPPKQELKKLKRDHSGSSTKQIDPMLEAALKAAPDAKRWPNNNYARLIDTGNLTVLTDGTTIAEYRETFKLFNQNARNLAEVTLPYNNSYQELRVLNARTIKKDGTVVPVSPDDMREGGVSAEYLMYDDAKSVNFSMPAIEDDCIIDYSYEIVTRPTLFPGQFTAYWGFTGPEPVGLCRYAIHVPVDKPMKFKTYNDDTLKPVVTTSLDGKTKNYVWERHDLAPIEPEPSMPATHDVRVWMEVSSLAGWQDIAHWFWGLQQPQAKPTDAVRATVRKITADMKTDEDKAKAIYNWVSNKTRYVGIEFGISAFKPHSAADVHDKLYGDCKDKANLLITMLGVAGIKAHPVLLHAAERRSVSTGLPTLNAFNHCITLAEVAGKDVWLDATAETCAYGDIPDSDRGVEALVVRKGIGKFETIPVYMPAENGVDLSQKIVIKSDGGADNTAEVVMRGQAGQEIRASVRTLKMDQRKEMMERLAASFAAGGKVGDFTLPDGDSKEGPFVMKMTLAAPRYAKKTSSLLLLPMPNCVVSGTKRSPYTKDKRVYPIVSEDSSQLKSDTVFTLPAGYTIEDVPADIDLVSPLQEYHRKSTRSADGRTLTVSDVFMEKPGTSPASDYAKIKTFYDDLLKTGDDQIVLKKSP